MEKPRQPSGLFFAAHDSVARSRRSCRRVAPRGGSRTQSLQASCGRSSRKTCLPKGLEEQDFGAEVLLLPLLGKQTRLNMLNEAASS